MLKFKYLIRIFFILLVIFISSCQSSLKSCSDFDKYDINKDNLITIDEFNNNFDKYDINKDNKIDRKEFCGTISGNF